MYALQPLIQGLIQGLIQVSGACVVCVVQGDVVKLVRRIDDNWYEGRLAHKQGIFPVSYVEVGQEPRTPLKSFVASPIPTPPVGTPFLTSSRRPRSEGSIQLLLICQRNQKSLGPVPTKAYWTFASPLIAWRRNSWDTLRWFGLTRTGK